MNKPTVAQIAARAGVPEANIRANFAKCAIQQRECEQKAIALGEKYRGYTADQWRGFAEHSETMAKE